MRDIGGRVYDIRARFTRWRSPIGKGRLRAPPSRIGQLVAGRRTTVEKQAGLARFVWTHHGRGDGNGFQVLRFSDDFLKTRRGRELVDAAREDD